jgi:hypothetical protein
MKQTAIRTVLATILLSIGLGAATASASSVKVYDGSDFKAVPTGLSGWNLRGLTDTKVVGITWRGWNSNRAIGLGTAVNRGCRSLPCGLADANDLSIWTRKKIRVTAFKPRGGAYQRLRLFQWTAWNKPREKKQYENYHFTVAFLGEKARSPWRVIRLDPGLR